MKKVLVFALIAVFALSLSSCGKKNEEKTNMEKISNAKGWELKSVTVSPEFDVYGHDFYKNYLKDWEKDDIITFNTNGSFIINPGSILPTEEQDGYITEVASTWYFSPDESKLAMQIPFMYDMKNLQPGQYSRTFSPVHEEVSISSLSETEMVLIYTSKGNFIGKDDTEYTWTITYTAK